MITTWRHPSHAATSSDLAIEHHGVSRRAIPDASYAMPNANSTFERSVTIRQIIKPHLPRGE